MLPTNISFVAPLPLEAKDGQFPLLLQLNTNPLVLLPSAAGQGTIDLPGDCDLEIHEWVAWGVDAAFPDVYNARFGVSYGSGDWSLNYPVSNQVRMEMVFGTAQRPGRISARPWHIATYGNRGLLTFTFTNLATTTNTIEICLRGFRTMRRGTPGAGL